MRKFSSWLAFRKSIFICHAGEKEDTDTAESISLRLRRQGFNVFLDKDSLQPGHAYDDRIREQISASSAFIVLISPNSVAPGRYTLTEIEFAKRRWPDPSGAVLPVMIAKTDLQSIPPYLRAVTILQTEGNVVAKVSAEVAKLLPRPRNVLPIFGLVAAFGLAAAATAAASIVAVLRLQVPDGGCAKGCNSVNNDQPVNPGPASPPGTDPSSPPKPAPAPSPTPTLVADPFPPRFALNFSLDLVDDTPYLFKDQVSIAVPAKRWNNVLGLNPDGYYLEQEDTPGKTSSFYAQVTRKVDTGFIGRPPVTSFCLKRADQISSPATITSTLMQCKEGDQPCAKFRADDEGLLAVSSACAQTKHSGRLDDLRGLVRFASFGIDAAMAQEPQRVWSVPSVDSLLARRNSSVLRDGFTVFTLQSAQKINLQANAVSLDLSIDDTPVLIEGVPADLQPQSFDPEQPLVLKFGLQNLNFAGRYAGCDRIGGRLQFYNDADAVGAPVSLELRYAALRNVEASPIQTELGTFTWSARYQVASNARTDWRVFVRSAPRNEPSKLEPVRQAIDDLSLVYSAAGQDYPVRAVLRPPLRGGWGLALGLMQPSGQIRFTFTMDEARQLQKFAQQKWRSDGAVRRLFDKEPDLYQEPTDADRRYSCGR
jgi:hypothetical protein